MEMACTNCTQLKQSNWILIFGGIHFFLSQLPNSNSVAAVSLAAAVMSPTYACLYSLDFGCMVDLEHLLGNQKERMERKNYVRLGNDGRPKLGGTGADLSTVSTQIKPFKGTHVERCTWSLFNYFINAICYFPVALIGYWAFGQDVDDNVLMNPKKPAWLIASANLMVVIHIIGSYQVYAIPVFELLERMMVKKINFPPGIALRLIARSSYVAFTLFVGVTFPFFGDLLGFFGVFGFAPTSYFSKLLLSTVAAPSIMWLVIKKPKRFSAKWIISWSCIFVGVFIMLASTIGGFRNIIADASTYSFYT
ncbi:hypothetical protein SO802_017390 [Lithocarpus litseifolius]|uniref:Amino acid transporter transmembrane domain-containing protein n=1 Tax=Lithocarpus litseifolius TaxID=425828 RepID=A0AAW2CK56_9ROSI